jgi:hypothetical protein
MTEVKYRDNKSESARITARLRPSNDMQTADTHVTTGTGPVRVHHTIHHRASNLQHENPKSRSLTDMRIRQTGDTDSADNARVPVAGPPNFSKGGR